MELRSRSSSPSRSLSPSLPLSRSLARNRFVTRADMCVLLFDPHKLDISGEMASVLEAFEGNEAKARVVLNKADSVPLGEMIKARARRALARSGPSGMKLRPLSLSLSRCTARSCGRSAR